MAPNNQIINKLSLTRKKVPTSQFRFPEMPKLYLELLENKDKIKQDLVNKEYVPRTSAPDFEFNTNLPLSTRLDELVSIDPDKGYNSSQDEASDNSDSDNDINQKFRKDTDSELSDDDSVIISPVHSSHSSYNASPKYKPNPISPPIKKYYSPSEDRYDSPNSSRHSIDLDDPISKQFSNNVYEYQEPIKRNTPPTHQHQPPTLSQLNMHDKTMPNLAYMKTNTEEEDLKRELLFKFDLLAKSYPNANIPTFTVHSDYKNMKQTHENMLRKLSIDTSVDSYKQYLIGGFLLVEYVLGGWLGFDMQGFTQQQITSLNTYERLLIELGEKSYVDEESQWPVEVRLLGMIIMNAAIFVVSKLIAKKTGSNILNMINSMNTNINSNLNIPKKKKPMRGPNINLDDFPDLSTM